MTFASLVWRNLAYHWRGNLAVFLGIALGSAILTGALLVGDSLRGSLRDLSLDRLGWVDATLAPGRFFTESLATAIPAEKRAPVIMLNGSASSDKTDPDRTVAVNLFGVTGDFFPAGSLRVAPNWSEADAQVVLSESLARDLRVKEGDTISINLPKPDAIPRETLLGKRKTDDVLESLSLKVAAVAGQDGMAGFSLRPSPAPAQNAFVPLAYLQQKLNLRGKVNAVLLAGVSKDVDLGKRLTLADWGLTLSTPADRARKLLRLLDPRNMSGKVSRIKWEEKQDPGPAILRIPDDLAKRATDGVLTLKDIEAFYEAKRRYLLLQSDHFYLGPTVKAALTQAFPLDETKYHPTLIYLADSLRVRGAETPYATIAAVRPDQVPGRNRLDDRDIVFVDWPGSPLRPKNPDLAWVEYYVPGAGNRLEKKEVQFTTRGMTPLTGDADDPDMTPEYPGLTDKLTIRDWENPPFPFDRKRIKQADEDYWKRYRATPRAYVTLAAGQKLFGSRFGDLTQLRIDVPPDADPAVAAKEFTAKLLATLKPADGGFAIQDIRGPALTAEGSNDFGMLFLGFSFFLIVSALLLVGLLVRLNLERRAKEIGLLAATGWEPRRIRRLLRREGWVLILLGAAAGLVVAVAFAWAMLWLLASKWPGEGTLQFLTLHATPKSFAIGFAATVAVSALTLRWAVRLLNRLTPRQLLAGETSRETVRALGPRTAGGVVSWLCVIGSIIGAVGLLVSSHAIKSHELLAGSFFGVGALMLAGLLSLTWRWLRRNDTRDPQPTLVRLAVRNAGRNPVRSLLTVGLLAAATFLIVAVQAFHREPTEDFLEPRNSGSGGYRLVAQTELPLFQALHDKATLADLNVKDEIAAKLKAVASCRVQPGDDASCLNLYKPLQPRIVSPQWTILDAFAFAEKKKDFFPQDIGDDRSPIVNRGPAEVDGAVPAVVDANTARWILNAKLGDVLKFKVGASDARFLIVGLLNQSLFQSEVLVPEQCFIRLFPNQQGYQFFLIDCDKDDQAEVMKALNDALAPYGGRVEPSIKRLEAYFAVENTYLATFQALGGLGLLLGAVGLAIVLVRGVWERRAELALLRAVGFRKTQLAAMVLAENGVLLILGLGVGCVSALASIAPQLLHGEAKLVVGQIAILLGIVTLTGLAAGALAVSQSLRAPVLEALRRE